MLGNLSRDRITLMACWLMEGYSTERNVEHYITQDICKINIVFYLTIFICMYNNTGRSVASHTMGKLTEIITGYIDINHWAHWWKKRRVYILRHNYAGLLDLRWLYVDNNNKHFIWELTEKIQ